MAAGGGKGDKSNKPIGVIGSDCLYGSGKTDKSDKSIGVIGSDCLHGPELDLSPSGWSL